MLPCSFSEVLAVLRADPVLGEEEGDNEAAQDELYDIGHGSDGERHSTRDPLEEDPGEHGEHVACLAVAVGVDATPAPTPRSTSPVHTCSSPSKDGQSSVSRFHFHARPGVEVLVEMRRVLVVCPGACFSSAMAWSSKSHHVRCPPHVCVNG